MKSNDKRRRVFADMKVQGGLCLRIAMYWFICQLAVVGTILGFASLESPAAVHGSVTRFLGPALFVSALVLPFVLLDVLVFSNRFAGPLLSFRREFKRLGAGQPTQEIRFRRGDHFAELCEDFNRVRDKLSQQQDETAAPPLEPTVAAGG